LGTPFHICNAASVSHDVNFGPSETVCEMRPNLPVLSKRNYLSYSLQFRPINTFIRNWARSSMSDILVREIQIGDLENGFLESMDALRKASDLDPAEARRILSGILSDPDHRIFVAEHAGRIIGSITLLIEQKFIHKGGRVAHMEDVVVTAKMQGKGVGEKMVRHVLDYARSRGCYKTIVDCLDDVRGFYEGVGFAASTHGLRFDH